MTIIEKIREDFYKEINGVPNDVDIIKKRIGFNKCMERDSKTNRWRVSPKLMYGLMVLLLVFSIQIVLFNGDEKTDSRDSCTSRYDPLIIDYVKRKMVYWGLENVLGWGKNVNSEMLNGCFPKSFQDVYIDENQTNLLIWGIKKRKEVFIIVNRETDESYEIGNMDNLKIINVINILIKDNNYNMEDIYKGNILYFEEFCGIYLNITKEEQEYRLSFYATINGKEREIFIVNN